MEASEDNKVEANGEAYEDNTVEADEDNKVEAAAPAEIDPPVARRGRGHAGRSDTPGSGEPAQALRRSRRLTAKAISLSCLQEAEGGQAGGRWACCDDIAAWI